MNKYESSQQGILLLVVASALITICAILLWFAFFILREWTHA